MKHLILRYVVVLLISIPLSFFGIKGNAMAVQSLFTVLGITFSISMSLIISFDLSQIMNEPFRKRIRTSIQSTRNGLIADFIMSTLLLLLSSLNKVETWELIIGGKVWFHLQTFAICVIVMSIFYEAHNFKNIHNLHEEIADAVIQEKK